MIRRIAEGIAISIIGSLALVGLYEVGRTLRWAQGRINAKVAADERAAGALEKIAAWTKASPYQ